MPTATQFFTAATTAMRLTGDPEAELIVTATYGLNPTQQAQLAQAMALWSDIADFGAYSAADDAARSRDALTWLGTQWKTSLPNDWTRVALGEITGSDVYGVNKAWGAGNRYHEIFIDTRNEGASTFQFGSQALETLLHQMGYSVLGARGVGPVENFLHSVMQPYPSIDPDTWHASTPMPDDITRAIALYGETSTRTGNDTYGFNARFSGDYRAALDFNVNTRPLVTIYDSGGNDTLNASGFVDAHGIPRPVQVNLNQGIHNASHMLNGPEIFAVIYDTTWIENAVGGDGSDHLIGNDHANRLIGGAGYDGIYGYDGADLIEGGAYPDIITGGEGSDTFIFKSVGHSRPGFGRGDLITDFEHRVDRFDVSAIDANGARPGNTSFTFLATAGAAFTGAGQIRWYYYPRDPYHHYTMIEASTDRDQAAEFAIKLDGRLMLSAGDFVL